MQQQNTKSQKLSDFERSTFRWTVLWEFFKLGIRISFIVSFVLYQSLMYIDTIFYNKHDLYSLNSHQFDKILWLLEFQRLIKCRLWRHEVARMRERISYQCFTITMLESIAHRMLHNLLCAKREPRGLLKGVSSSATTTWSILITLHWKFTQFCWIKDFENGWIRDTNYMIDKKISLDCHARHPLQDVL